MTICQSNQCETNASFNVEGSEEAIYCRQHAEAGMVDIRSKRCSHKSCTRQPSFNVEGSEEAIYCRQHAEAGMVDVRNKRCSHKSCTRQPSFNVEGSEKAIYCRQHAEAGMVDVRHKRCSHKSCTRRPRWGVISEGGATVCSQHLDDLVHGATIDFMKRCAVTGCHSIAKWGDMHEQPTHCPQHGPLQDGLVCVVEGKYHGKGATSTKAFRRRRSNGDSDVLAKRARKAIPRTATHSANTSAKSPEEDEPELTGGLRKQKDQLIIWL